MTIGCEGYRMSRRAFVGAATGTFLGLSVRNLVALAGTDHAAKAEHVILFWNGGGMSHLVVQLRPAPGRGPAAFVPRNDGGVFPVLPQQVLGEVETRARKPFRPERWVGGRHPVGADQDGIPCSTVRPRVSDYAGIAPDCGPELLGVRD